MKTRTSCICSGGVQRGGFTLVELLVVITIMVALMALTASAVLKFIGVQQTSNTQSYLDRVQSQLGRAWSKVKDQALKEPIPPALAAWMQTPYPTPSSPITFAGTDTNATQRMRYLYVKLKLRQAFPMSFNEALSPPPPLPTMPPTPCPLPPLPVYQAYLGSLGINGSTPGTLPYESSACLLMALQRGVSGAGIDPSDLTAGGAAGNYNGISYLTDGWGRPIFFSRVPTGNSYLNPTGTALPGANDPGDPQGYLNTPQWVTTAGPQFFASTLQPVAAGASYKLAPIVASGGPSNWQKSGILTFDPITFAQGDYVWPGGPLIPSSTYALFSTP